MEKFSQDFSLGWKGGGWATVPAIRPCGLVWGIEINRNHLIYAGLDDIRPFSLLFACPFMGAFVCGCFGVCL